MSKKNSIFYCQNCGTSSSKWLGKCPSCNQWNTFVEERTSKKESKKDESEEEEYSHEENVDERMDIEEDGNNNRRVNKGTSKRIENEQKKY